MPASLPTLLFWAAVLAVIVAQVAILRSTARAWALAGTRVPFVERVFAWGPALVLALVLWLSWRAATRPPIVEVQFDPASQSITL
ncbi:MAG: hypothetical protein KF689_01820 [Gemmatimonadaceae bacterium]|nr:hypothetical protein [Gemmatimonadaceae bacterium]MCW5826668.1 hypothetical protein [Gemmatimonadaceae bacterium]